ncbi:alpha/beta hydrolase [Niameybacter massiliensis]|uniref:Alpha/beta hydrolase n=1 Tax=Holtiella tumoricola TaxID=3018743 RepID=A0AA42DL59_9FIRM|nr:MULTISPECIES: alpha/beta hydrolase [Lachnospirales]MDA3730974.1 alpha/beta hydrolase [Holtiella tumoricola]
MYFEEIGDPNKQTIVMLHGAGMPQTFVGQYELADKYHLILPHLYGNGEESNKSYNREECIEGILEIVKGLNKDKVSIVGFSLGAQLIIPILCSAENYFNKAILISPWICKSEQGIEEVTKVIKNQMVRAMKINWFLKIQAKWIGMDKIQREKFLKYCKETTVDNLVNMTLYGVNIEDYNEYRDIKIPMLALAGSKESKEVITSVDTLEKLNKNCYSRILTNFEHDIPYKQPKHLNEIIDTFLMESN